jgi:hypothetical protein
LVLTRTLNQSPNWRCCSTTSGPDSFVGIVLMELTAYGL